MLQMIEANWLAFIAALLIGLLVAWWVYARGSTIARPRERKPDALDEGSAPAERNQSLIDAPPAAKLVPPAGAGAMAGIGEVIAVAAQDEVQEQAVRAADEATASPTPESPQTPEPPVASRDATDGDDLSQIKGVGPKLVVLLHSLGVTRFEQVAGWTDEDLARVDDQLGAFKGRPQRDNWIEQAKLLAGGDSSAYEAKFGKL